MWPDNNNPCLDARFPACGTPHHPPSTSQHLTAETQPPRKTALKQQYQKSLQKLQIQSFPTGHKDTYLVSRRTTFYFPSTTLQKIWVEKFWTTFVIWLEESECDSNGCGSWFRVLGLLSIVFPRPFQEAAAQWTVESGERNPVGLGHGYGQVLPVLMA